MIYKVIKMKKGKITKVYLTNKDGETLTTKGGKEFARVSIEGEEGFLSDFDADRVKAYKEEKIKQGTEVEYLVTTSGEYKNIKNLVAVGTGEESTEESTPTESTNTETQTTMNTEDEKLVPEGNTPTVEERLIGAFGTSFKVLEKYQMKELEKQGWTAEDVRKVALSIFIDEGKNKRTTYIKK